MESLSVKTEARVIRKLNNATLWYLENRDRSFVETMLKNYQEAVVSLSHTPTMGNVVRKNQTREYRTYVVHKKCILVYWYNSKNLYITDLIFTNTFKDRY
ncbi:MAG: hypothetical protein MJZ27_09735 [Bacteroidales bacterium]|nr:hypothetical protein [Bacteroidales bacterium]